MNLEEKLAVAWSRIKQDRRTDFIIGDFEYRVFDIFKDELLRVSADRIEQLGDDYEPEPLQTIRVPKERRTTRPCAVPSIQDRLLFQTLVDDIADLVEASLAPIDDHVLHSYRYSGDRQSADMFHFSAASWATFEKRVSEIGRSHRHVLLTDVSACYERIYHHEVHNVLLGLGAYSKDVEGVVRLLRKWTRGKSYGLPQGLWPSDYLGNVYLDPIDKLMVRASYAYCRFVDDMAIGIDSRAEADKALLTLETALAPLGLSLNAAKTRFVRGADVARTLDPHGDRIGALMLELREQAPEMGPYFHPTAQQIEELEVAIEIESVAALLAEELGNEFPDQRVLNFCLRKLRTFQYVPGVSLVAKNLNHGVVATPAMMNYMIAVANMDPKIKRRVVTKLSQGLASNQASYDWQMMWLIHGLHRIGDLGSTALGRVRDHVASARHPAVRANGYVLLGRLGDHADRKRLLAHWDDEQSPWVRRALLYSLRDLPATERNHFFSYCKGQDPLTDKVIEYVGR